jgi:RNA polymerase sigma factor FliA
MKTPPSHENIPNDSIIPDEVLKRKVVVSLLAKHIDQLSAMPKKILAMHYHEKMPPSEIAACFNLTESHICQIHAQTVALIHEDVLPSLILWSAKKCDGIDS